MVNEIRKTREWFEDFSKTYTFSEQEETEFQKAITFLCKLEQFSSIGTVEDFEVLIRNQRNCKDCAGCTVWKCDCSNERAIAIDKFTEKLYQDYVYDSICRNDISFYGYGNKIKEIAEQVKAGGIK